jgi:hypothetical protein
MNWSEFSFILKPSPLGGVGVFAVHDLEAGVPIANKPCEVRIISIEDVPPPLRQYCVYISEKEAICPERFDRMEIGWFVNHSATPNIEGKNVVCDLGSMSKEDILKALKARTAVTLREIKAGEEILINYNSLNEPEQMKEEYFRQA